MMKYIDIIQKNCEKHSRVSWWPRFAFHYTDVTNAVSILRSQHLYSRIDATQLNVMKNDNASRQVIDMTNSGATSKVRFYFRPLTPTQYYNEGYKHSELRYDCDENANVPVPVFFLFDLSKLLELKDVQFSETSQAGAGAVLYSGVEEFSQLNFDYIYDNGCDRLFETKKYRLAEIVHPNSVPIDSCISYILCRNSLERMTLLNLLKTENRDAFMRYRDIIKVCKSKDVFQKNGLFLTECVYGDNTVSISIADTFENKYYIDRMMKKNRLTELKPIKTTIILTWYEAKCVCEQKKIQMDIDACKTRAFTFTGLPQVPKAKEISIKVFFEDKLMCYVIQSLEAAELWK